MVFANFSMSTTGKLLWKECFFAVFPNCLSGLLSLRKENRSIVPAEKVIQFLLSHRCIQRRWSDVILETWKQVPEHRWAHLPLPVFHRRIQCFQWTSFLQQYWYSKPLSLEERSTGHNHAECLSHSNLLLINDRYCWEISVKMRSVNHTSLSV